MYVTIKLELNGHCIETAAKEKLQQLLDAMFQTDTEDLQLQALYQLLYDFIHTADFAQLRASDERLAGIVPSICEVYIDKTGKPSVRII